MNWRSLVLFFGAIFLSSYAGAQQVAVGACGKPLPADKSRYAKNMRLLCGGSHVNFDRRPVKSAQWDEWSVLERSDAAGSPQTRQEMQQLRLKEEPIIWKGQTIVKTYETWTWLKRMRGRNPQHCSSHKVTVACKKDRPVYRQVCLDREEEENNSPSQSGGGGTIIPVPVPGGGNSRSNSNGGYNNSPRDNSRAQPNKPQSDPWSTGSGKSRENGAATGGGMNTEKQRETYKDYKERKEPRSAPASPPPKRESPPPKSSPAPAPKKEKESNRRTWIQEFSIFPKAVAADSCQNWGKEFVRNEQYDSTCETVVVDECEWEEEQYEMQACGENTVNYQVEYKKPDVKTWNPSSPGYHDLLPNKYDLLPGEWEKIYLDINDNARASGIPSSLAAQTSGKSETIRSNVRFESQGQEAEGWNKYQVSFERPEVKCELNSTLEVHAYISTVERIVRKAPNALAIPVDRLGREDALKAAEKWLGVGEKVRLRPNKIQLLDKSNETMMTAARQSRKFKDLDANAVTKTHDTKSKALTAQDLGFWKNTLVKIRLVEKNSCFMETDKLFADVLDTSSKLTKAEGDRLVVQLDGQQPGVPSFYQPFGYIGKFMGFFYGGLDLQPTPGRNYEFRISMLQQGLPFYENGCLNGAKTCDQKDANPQMYSDELVIGFTADPREDSRGWLQTFENWHGRKLWNKFSDCK